VALLCEQVERVADQGQLDQALASYQRAVALKPDYAAGYSNLGSALVAQGRGSLLANLREQFAEFLQHSSLKRLGILYQSTCVGFGYGL